MSNRYVTVEADRYELLIIAEREATCLKNLLKERKYLGINGVECALICKALGIPEED